MHKHISYQVILNPFQRGLEKWHPNILFMFKQHEYNIYILKANYLLDVFDKF